MEQLTAKAEDIIYFKEGIPGFEHLTQFILLEEGDGIFYYLQAIEDEAINFAIMNPFLLIPDYAPHISESYFEKLGGGKSEEFTMYVISTVRGSMQESTINLQAPLLIHVDKRIGVQAIVDDKHYHTRHKIADLLHAKEESVC